MKIPRHRHMDVRFYLGMAMFGIPMLSAMGWLMWDIYRMSGSLAVLFLAVVIICTLTGMQLMFTGVRRSKDDEPMGL
jgi:hypothetical protein